MIKAASSASASSSCIPVVCSRRHRRRRPKTAGGPPSLRRAHLKGPRRRPRATPANQPADQPTSHQAGGAPSRQTGAQLLADQDSQIKANLSTISGAGSTFFTSCRPIRRPNPIRHLPRLIRARFSMRALAKRTIVTTLLISTLSRSLASLLALSSHREPRDWFALVQLGLWLALAPWFAPMFKLEPAANMSGFAQPAPPPVLKLAACCLGVS